MTAAQWALLAGAVVGLGVACLVWYLVPAQPNLADALTRLSPGRTLRRPEDGTPETVSTEERVGLWVMRHGQIPTLGKTPIKELAILARPTHSFYGEKALLFILGLAIPQVLAVLSWLSGGEVGFAMPLLGSLVLATGLSVLPDVQVKRRAAAARSEFRRGLSAYMDLVALKRLGGSGARQALEQAAAVGDSWVFRRIEEDLRRTRWSGDAPWDGLAALGKELGLAELSDLADTMRLTKEDAAVYENLRAKAASMRGAMLNEELARANAIGEQMTIPVSLLGLVFLAIMVTPAILRFLSTAGGGI